MAVLQRPDGGAVDMKFDKMKSRQPVWPGQHQIAEPNNSSAMWYKTIFLAGSLLATFHLPAQQFSLGLRGGYSLSETVQHRHHPSSSNQQDQPALPGFHAGVEGRLEFSERFALLTGLQYARKGYVSTLFWPTGLAEARYVLHYGNLPVAGSYRIWKGLALQGGVEAGWLLRARGKSLETTFNPEIIVDLYKDFDLGLLAGLEYQFGKSFFLGARHIFGITPVFATTYTDENGQELGDVRSYNSSTQLSVGYRYYFDK